MHQVDGAAKTSKVSVTLGLGPSLRRKQGLASVAAPNGEEDREQGRSSHPLADSVGRLTRECFIVVERALIYATTFDFRGGIVS